jgi:hypothetical protein
MMLKLESECLIGGYAGMNDKLKRVFVHMKKDSVMRIAKSDKLIVEVGNAWLSKTCQTSPRHI